MTPRTRLSLLLAATGALLCLLVVPAGAHAQVTATTPFDGEVLAAPPDRVLLEFNEAVDVPVSGIRVYDATGARVDLGDVDQPTPDAAAVGVPPDLGRGTYVVTYRAVSDDGHPIKGAFVFSVEQADDVDASVFATLFSADADRPFAIAAAGARWAGYATALLLAGALLFAVRVRAADEATWRLLRRVAGAGIAAAIVALPLQTALETGFGLSTLTNGEALRATATSPFGMAAAVRMLALVAALVAVRRRDARLGLVGATVALLSFAGEGHTLTSDPAWLVVAADVAHLAAGAAWFGGLVLLAHYLRVARADDDPVTAAGVVARFSSLATWSLVAVTVAGAALSFVEVRAPRALTSTTYGWTLVAKLAVVLLVVAAGAWNQRRLVPAVAARTPDGDGTDVESATAPAWSLLRRLVRLEVVGIVLVLGVTSVLVNLQPAAEAAGISGAFSTYQPFGDDGLELNIVVDPNRVGTNQIHLYLLDETGRPKGDVEDLTIELSNPSRDIGPLVRTPEDAGPGHWVLIGPELSVPGEWVITVVAGIDRFTEVRSDVAVTVNP